ncbi:lipid kinase [Enemella dayhoffiae]|uniref:Lipid kinase n=1 Tax=Enemella dayhoffiae TaxID=2016507 RepID=A0A255H356_9ACTN|nr:YegS/Rv2252/BmrU family lipid kinase [Enemella dayhoffiae]OYO22091.1 lipid kinase [Enemella dayhoffiae]
MAGLTRYDGSTLTLVVNPTAGRGRAAKLLPQVCRELLQGRPGATLRVHQTTNFAEARQRTIAAAAAARPAHDGVPADALLVMGGDGMMTLGVNACAGTEVPLGLIPAGTGNDMCRGLGIRVFNPVQAAHWVIGGQTRRVDTLRVEGDLVEGAEVRHIGTVVATGYDSRVNRRANRMRLPIGNLRYAASALAELAVFEPLTYRLRIDGRQRTQPAMFIAVGNGAYFGGGMKICPDADVTDGLLDVTVIHPVSRATLLRLLPAMFSGSFVRDPAVERFRARVVEVDGDGLFGMGDGEELGPTPLRISVEPSSLTVFGTPPAG